MILKYNMKEQTSSLLLTSREIAVVRAISNSDRSTIGELAAIIGKSESSISQTVKGLEKKGFVKSKKDGLKKFPQISERNYALSFSDLIRAEPYVPWEKLISNSNISVLLKYATGEDSFEYGISPVSTWRAIRNLSLYGLIKDTNDGKAIGDSYLLDFIKQYSEHASRTHFLNILPREAVIIWRSGFCCLFKISNRINEGIKGLPEGAFPSALSVYPKFGIQFMTSDSYFYYEPDLDGLTIEDILIHTLLMRQENQTYTTYALLLAIKAGNKINFTTLLEKSQKYGLKEMVKNMVNYIKSKGKNRKWPLPKLNELKEQAELYGIVVN